LGGSFLQTVKRALPLFLHQRLQCSDVCGSAFTVDVLAVGCIVDPMFSGYFKGQRLIGARLPLQNNPEA
jgi:hypothetical protein